MFQAPGPKLIARVSSSIQTNSKRACRSTSVTNRLYWRARWRQFAVSPNPKRSKRIFKIVSASTLATAAIVGNTALKVEKITDEKLPTDPIGPVYKFDEELYDPDDELPTTYDVAAIERYWKKRPIEVAQRSVEVLTLVIPYISKLILWEYLIRRQIQDEPGLQKKYAIKLRDMLTDLGPCFIKFGQALSIRPDLLPSPFLSELQKLCDSVPSFPTQEAISVIEAELG